MGIFDYFRSTTPPVVEKPEVKAEVKNAVRALPGSWYTSEELYQLERRSIFARKWIMITNSMRLKNPGDHLKYDVAGFDFVLCRDQDGELNGFRYACDLDEVQTGVFPIHIHLDLNGFIWVNLDGKEEPEIAWNDDFLGVDQQSRYQGLDFTNYVFDHTWQMDGDYNWKILSDNYNECYHCATTHPDLNALTDLQAYSVVPVNHHLEHYVATKPEHEANGLRVHPTYFFPSTSMNISRDFIMVQRFVPHGPCRSTMLYEVYRNKNALDTDFQLINEMYKRVMSEDKALCELAQKNVNAGIFINGEMHPRLERGPLWFQGLCRDIVVNFRQREVAAGHQIVPTRVTLPERVRDSADFGVDLATQTRQEVAAY